MGVEFKSIEAIRAPRFSELQPGGALTLHTSDFLAGQVDVLEAAVKDAARGGAHGSLDALRLENTVKNMGEGNVIAKGLGKALFERDQHRMPVVLTSGSSEFDSDSFLGIGSAHGQSEMSSRVEQIPVDPEVISHAQSVRQELQTVREEIEKYLGGSPFVTPEIASRYRSENPSRSESGLWTDRAVKKALTSSVDESVAAMEARVDGFKHFMGRETHIDNAPFRFKTELAKEAYGWIARTYPAEYSGFLHADGLIKSKRTPWEKVTFQSVSDGDVMRALNRIGVRASSLEEFVREARSVFEEKTGYSLEQAKALGEKYAPMSEAQKHEQARQDAQRAYDHALFGQ